MAENLKTFSIAKSSTQYQERLNELDQAIASVKKNITYLDTLNIIDAVTDKKNFAAQINALTPNSSLVINTEPFNEGGINYSRGDIILKDASDIIHHIPGQSGGLYYPKKITTKDNVNYNIEYSFINAIPTQSSASATMPSEKNEEGVYAAEVDPAAMSIVFNGLSGGDASESNVYGLFTSASVITLTLRNEASAFIEPMVEFYWMSWSGNDKIMERVEIDYQLDYFANGGLANLYNPLPGSPLYMKVK